VDADGNVYIFDYDDYYIHKYDPSGSHLTAFGGTSDVPDGFVHLMAIQVHGDSLLALDEGSLSVFALDGALLSRHAFTDSVICDYPRFLPDGRWAGEWIIGETAEYALTYRNADGTERRRIASYALGELYPGIQAGELFYINRVQAPTYLYDFLADGRLLWMSSDNLSIYGHEDDEDVTLYQSAATPIPYPAEEIEALKEQQAGLNPPLFVNVPHFYQIAHHLLVDGSGDIWLYVKCAERTGFLRLSPTGRETGFFTVEADFDMLSARVKEADGKMYFLVAGRDETAVYAVDLP